MESHTPCYEMSSWQKHVDRYHVWVHGVIPFSLSKCCLFVLLMSLQLIPAPYCITSRQLVKQMFVPNCLQLTLYSWIPLKGVLGRQGDFSSKAELVRIS